MASQMDTEKVEDLGRDRDTGVQEEKDMEESEADLGGETGIIKKVLEAVRGTRA